MLTPEQINHFSDMPDSQIQNLVLENVFNAKEGAQIVKIIEILEAHSNCFSIRDYSQMLKICIDRIVEIKTESSLNNFIQETFEFKESAEIVDFESLKVYNTIDKIVSDANNFTLEKKSLSPDEIKQIRQTLNMTQEYFANYLGFSVNTIRQWEQGSRKPSKKSLKILAGAMN